MAMDCRSEDTDTGPVRRLRSQFQNAATIPPDRCRPPRLTPSLFQPLLRIRHAWCCFAALAILPVWWLESAVVRLAGSGNRAPHPKFLARPDILVPDPCHRQTHD